MVQAVSESRLQEHYCFTPLSNMSISVDMGMRLISLLFGIFWLVPASLAQEATAEDAANSNAQVTQVAAATAATPQVQFVDAQAFTINDARFTAANASRDKIAIVVWGGNRAIQQEAFFAARDLAGAGIPTAFVLAPDGNGIEADAYLEIYAASTPRRDGTIANNGAERIRQVTRDGGLAAYREAFPEQWVALQARQQ